MRKSLLISTVAALAAAALSTASAGGAASPLRGVFVGRVAGSNAFVAVAVGHGKARAYLCDSRRLAVWLPLGKLRGTQVDLEGARVHLTGGFGREGAQGTVTLADGTRHAFHGLLAPGRGPAGLYRAARTVRGHRYIAGWILLRGGAQRGSVVRFIDPLKFAVEAVPALNPEAATAQVTEGGVATVVKLGDSFIAKTTTD